MTKLLAYHNKVSVKNKYCLHCETRLIPKGYESITHFTQRKFCNAKCFGKNRTASVTDPSWNFAHKQARELKPITACERCETTEKKSEVHHIDNNFKNNNLGNLRRLCPSCHKIEHNRGKNCTVCGLPQHARLLCNRHYIQLRRGLLCL